MLFTLRYFESFHNWGASVRLKHGRSLYQEVHFAIPGPLGKSLETRTIATRLEAIATRVEAIAIRNKAKGQEPSPSFFERVDGQGQIRYQWESLLGDVEQTI